MSANLLYVKHKYRGGGSKTVYWNDRRLHVKGLILYPRCAVLAFTGAFDILVYTDKDLQVPDSWKESGPAMISNSQEVKLRSFSTQIHKVDSMVTYKYDD